MKKKGKARWDITTSPSILQTASEKKSEEVLTDYNEHQDNVYLLHTYMRLCADKFFDLSDEFGQKILKKSCKVEVELVKGPKRLRPNRSTYKLSSSLVKTFRNTGVTALILKHIIHKWNLTAVPLELKNT